MSLNSPYRQHSFMGMFVDAAAALVYIRANRWDSTKNGLGAAERGMIYYNTTVETLYFYNGTSWLVLATGILWQTSVLDQLNNPPGAPGAGDRYLVNTVPVGAWVGHANAIAVWDGSAWDFTAAVEGMAVWVEDVNRAYQFNSVAWVELPSSANHNDLLNIQGGAAGDYYHFTNVQHTDLTDGGATTLHAHTLDSSYDAGAPGGGRSITVDTGDVEFNLSGANSVLVSMVAATGVADGLLVENGADYLRVKRSNVDKVTWEAALTSATVSSDDAFGLTLAANDGAAHSFNLAAANAGAGPAQVAIAGKTAVTLDSSAGNISLDGVTSSNFTVAANAAGNQTLSVACTNAGAGQGIVALSAKSSVTLDAPTLSLDATSDSNFTVTSNAAGTTALTLRSTNSGAGVGSINIFADGSIYGDAAASSRLSIAANSASDGTLTLSSENAGAGDGYVEIYCDNLLTMYSIAGGVDIDAKTGSHFSVVANAAGNQTLLLSCTNAGAGDGDVSLSADNDINFTARAGTLTFNDVGNISLHAYYSGVTSIMGALNQVGPAGGKRVTTNLPAVTAGIVVDFIDNVDEGAGIFKGGLIVYDFFVQGATAGTSDLVYGGVIRIKFHGTDTLLTRITVEWVVDADPDVEFDAAIAGDQIRLLADNAAATAITFCAIRRDYVTALAHV